MCGLPGTGKSYFAAKLTEQVPFLILETDRLRKVLVDLGDSGSVDPEPDRVVELTPTRGDGVPEELVGAD